MRQTDEAISEVVGTIILIAVVTIFVCGITLSLLSLIAEQAEYVPAASFRQSESENYLYHAGGDALQKSEIRIYYLDTDITDKTTINGKIWDVWKTGDALYLTAKYQSYLVTVAAKTSTGRVVILYNGQKTDPGGVGS